MAKKLIVPRRAEDFFDKNGNPTLRFINFLEGMTEQTNTNTGSAESNSSGQVIGSATLEQAKAAGGIRNFTMDSTGFTMDSTQWSMDKVRV